MVKVVLIGLGAVGLTYAVKLRDKCDLSILADSERILKYKSNLPVFNEKEQKFNYITPEASFEADVIFITTKSHGLDSAIESIKNFVSPKTRIISLINGISSEPKIKKAYPQAYVLKSYFIGHSAVKKGNSVFQDGVGEIVIEHDDYIEKFFKNNGINYSIPNDIEYSMWLKYTFNIFANQVSAVLNMNFGEMKRNTAFKEFARKTAREVSMIAKAKGVKNYKTLEDDAIKSLEKMCADGKTSMLQDILAHRPTEVEIFSGELLRMGKELGIDTPYNQVLYDLIKIKEENNEYSVYTG